MAIVTTITGKRPHRWLYDYHNRPSPYSSRSKRHRVLSMSHNHEPSPLSTTTTTTNATVSRISRYPEVKPPLHREVHAPCRPRRFEISTSSRTESSLKTSDIGNLLNEKYQQAKISALATIRLRGNDNNAVSEDSKSVEEVVHLIEEVQPLKESDLVDKDEIKDLDAKDEVVNGGIQQHSTSSVVSELSNGNLNSVDAAKMFDALSLSPEDDLSGVSAYKKLLEAVGKRADTIGRLSYEIQLNEKRKSVFDLLRPKKELVEVKT